MPLSDNGMADAFTRGFDSTTDCSRISVVGGRIARPRHSWTPASIQDLNLTTSAQRGR